MEAGSGIVEMRGITKRFPGVLANDRVDLVLRAGQIHALLGENGAGKSTLMSILTGLYRPDEGDILIKGRKAVLRSPGEAFDHGIGMVHQHFRLVRPFTVAENVVLGLKSHGFLYRQRDVEGQIGELSSRYGLRVDPTAKVWQLSVGEQQRVEILKVLFRGAEVLILDEPTAVLTPQEAKDLYRTLRQMADQGHVVVFITHKLEEVMDAADVITVLRGGRNVATVAKTDTDQRRLARMMVGREVFLHQEKAPVQVGRTVLELCEIDALSDKGRPALRDLSLTVRSGEILGLAGVAGNGQRELAEVITGLRRVQSGRLLIGGRDLTNRSPREIIDAGVSHIPEDRLGMGLIPGLGICDNLILKDYRFAPMSSGPFLNHRAISEYAGELVRRFDVKVANFDSPVRLLSGGNLQKLLLAREISAKPKLIVAMLPTRGLDVGATEAIRQILLAQRAGGAAILMVSEDLDEVLSLSDRVAVINEGRIMGEMPAEQADIEEIGLLMAGSKGEGGRRG
ncbi:MAG TPA: ABC transporter ATP-binding protein [Bacillota bacterium]|jgi:simple sugar transport system ATP-binding protein